VNQDGEVVVSGTAEVIAPKQKVRRPRVNLPEVHFDDKQLRFRHIMSRVRARKLPPVKTAVVQPVDAISLAGASFAAQQGCIVPILVGSERAIREAAEAAAVDIKGFEIRPAGNSLEAVAIAIRMARDGEIQGIMNGSSPPEDLVVQAVAANGLRTDRRISHVHALDIPAYSKPLFVTDSMINIAPGLSEKREICQNAIDLAHWLQIPAPKVALLAAVDTINPRMEATVHAATLCKMAERGQISGGILDGPLTVDHAVSLNTMKHPGIRSAVAGQADILLAPDLESGNMIARQLASLADALSAGIVLGARVPITLTGRGDDQLSWAASAALVQIVALMTQQTGQERPVPSPSARS
jgi:phosphate acetyltransferase